MKETVTQYEQEIISFAQDLIKIQSYSDEEKEIALFIKSKLISLGYDEVIIDSMGNVIGRIGTGEKIIMLDSHMDTVEVEEEAWDVPPFSGEIIDNNLYGRGSVDMKSSIAASIYAGVIARELNYHADKTIYVTCTVNEEYCDGESLKHLLKELKLRPDYVIICEPTGNQIALGHNGKAQIKIRTKGISSHGASPEEGVNAIYEMAEIIQRVEQKNKELRKNKKRYGTLVMSDISSKSVSLNAVPSECEVYLDRRLILGEDESVVNKEMDEIIKGKNAEWEIDTIHRKSWKGLDINYVPYHLAWEIKKDHELTQACNQAYKETFGEKPNDYVYWDFSTNAVTPIGLGIPTIGFGPGEIKLAHMVNENCKVSNIIEACNFYSELIKAIK